MATLAECRRRADKGSIEPQLDGRDRWISYNPTTYTLENSFMSAMQSGQTGYQPESPRVLRKMGWMQNLQVSHTMQPNLSGGCTWRHSMATFDPHFHTSRRLVYTPMKHNLYSEKATDWVDFEKSRRDIICSRRGYRCGPIPPSNDLRPSTRSRALRSESFISPQPRSAKPIPAEHHKSSRAPTSGTHTHKDNGFRTRLGGNMGTRFAGGCEVAGTGGGLPAIHTARIAETLSPRLYGRLMPHTAR
eukprot:Rmarinus@m.17077